MNYLKLWLCFRNLSVCCVYNHFMVVTQGFRLHFEGLTNTPFNMNGCTSNQAVQFVILIPDKSSHYVNFSPKLQAH